MNDLLALLFRFELLNVLTDGLVLELCGDVGHIGHHASRLKGIPIEVEKDHINDIRTVVGVDQCQITCQAMCLVI